MTRLAITGAAGRMGQRLIALAQDNDQLTVVAATERAGHDDLGKDAGELAGLGKINVVLAETVDVDCDVLIDFTVPASTRQWVDVCRQRKIAMLIGTTGLEPADHALFDEASNDIALLQAPNTSLGVNLLLTMVGEVANRLGDDYDIEVVEAHHRFKKDAPSGTAAALADAIVQATGRTQDDLVYGRHGVDAERTPRQIGMHSLRNGDEVGRHTVSYATLGERIEITHAATTRDTFARGALRAAAWLAGKPAKRYTMRDVLGI